MSNDAMKDCLEHPRLARWRQKLLREATALCRDAVDAEDLVQEVFERAMDQDFDELEYPLAWLRQTLKNLYIDKYRRRDTRRRVMREHGEATKSTVDPRIDSGPSVDESALSEALQTLPAPMAQSLVLVIVEQYTYAEAAEVQDVAEGTVKSRVARARKKLADLLHRPPTELSSGGPNEQ